MNAAPPLDESADSQLRISAAKMAKAVSATTLVKRRPGFGQTIKPAKGSVLAAIGSANTEDEPDYFFHWLRDSAAIMDAALILIRHGIDADQWKQRFAEFVRFSLDAGRISGRRFLSEAAGLRERTAPDFQQFLRPDAEISAVEGDAVLGEVRYNADGTLDFLRWNRPQHDGPAARALTCLRFLDAGAVPENARNATAELLQLDLHYTKARAGAPCFDIWEEEWAVHFYACLMQHAALQEGARWAEGRGETAYASECAEAAKSLYGSLGRFWSPERGFYLSRIMTAGGSTTKELDFSVVLGVLHAGWPDGRFSVGDEQAAITLKRLEERFAADYAINRGAGAGIAFGRYGADTYVSGGAWFISTFGAAEFCYKRALATADRGLIARGDAMLEMARRFIPASGDISEQFDQTTGEQTSAKDLTWSHAAFITAWEARQNALRTAAGKRGDTI